MTMESNGKSQLFLGGDFVIYCLFDLTFFPFDTQKCTMKVGGWSSSSKQERLTPLGSAVNLENITGHEQWKIDKVVIEDLASNYNGDVAIYSEITFSFYLRRKSSYYLTYVFFPSMVISMVTACTFLIPPDLDNRLGLTFTALLAQSVFQSMVGNDMPKSSDHVPLLSLYLFLMDFYIFVAIALQCLAVYLAKVQPKQITTIISSLLEKVSSRPIDVENLIEMGNKVDRVSFTVYMALIFLTPVILLLVVPGFN